MATYGWNPVMGRLPSVLSFTNRVQSKQGDSLVADQVHVYSSGGPNTIGRTQMKELAQDFGKANDATEVTIKCGARATGPTKGQRPQEVTFDVPED